MNDGSRSPCDNEYAILHPADAGQGKEPSASSAPQSAIDALPPLARAAHSAHIAPTVTSENQYTPAARPSTLPVLIVALVGYYVVTVLVTVLMVVSLGSGDSGSTNVLESMSQGPQFPMHYLLWGMVIGQIPLFVILPVVWARARRLSVRYFLNTRPCSAWRLAWLIPGVPCMMGTVMAISLLLPIPESHVIDMTRQWVDMLRADSPIVLVWIIFAVAIVPGVCEEMLFRGLVQQGFQRRTRSLLWSVIISSLLFAGYHFMYYELPMLFVIGLTCGVLSVRGGSIWYAVIAHMVNNLWAIMSINLFDEQVLLAPTDMSMPLVCTGGFVVWLASYVVFADTSGPRGWGAWGRMGFMVSTSCAIAGWIGIVYYLTTLRAAL